MSRGNYTIRKKKAVEVAIKAMQREGMEALNAGHYNDVNAIMRVIARLEELKDEVKGAPRGQNVKKALENKEATRVKVRVEDTQESPQS